MLTCYFYRQAATLRIGAIMMVIAAHYLWVNGEQIEFNCFEEGTLRPGEFSLFIDAQCDCIRHIL